MRHEQYDDLQVDSVSSIGRRRRYLSGFARGGTVFLVITGLIAAVAFTRAALSQPPVLQSKYTAQQIAAARDHELYDTFYGAQLIVVGTVVKQEGFVPAVEFEINAQEFMWVLAPTRSLYVNAQFAKNYEEYSLGCSVPDADLHTTPYILARTFGERQTHLGRASKDVLQVASIAIEQRKHDDAVQLHQAKTDPASHPLFKAIRAAKNVATVEVLDGMAASTSYDRAGNVESLNERIDEETHIVMLAADLRGKLPIDSGPFSHLRIGKPLPSPVESQPLIVVWELQKTRADATHLETMNEATLLIAAAAMKRDVEGFVLDAKGPQEGSSRSSRGAEEPGGFEDVPTDHHFTEEPGDVDESP